MQKRKENQRQRDMKEGREEGERRTESQNPEVSKGLKAAANTLEKALIIIDIIYKNQKEREMKGYRAKEGETSVDKFTPRRGRDEPCSTVFPYLRRELRNK